MQEQLLQIPFYSDWKFWSFAVALTALVLSQLPPLHILFRRVKLDAEVYSQIYITHKLGNPNAQLHLIFSNTGGGELRVRNIELKFSKSDGDEFTLPAKNYLQLPSDKETVLFTSFKLKPGEEWAHIVNFLNFFSRKEDKEYRQMESNLRQDILAKLGSSADKNEIVSAEDDNVTPLIEFFQKKFKWGHGEYNITLQVQTEPPNAIQDKHFRITLFESDSNELDGYKNDYKYGLGVSLNSDKHTGLLISLSEA